MPRDVLNLFCASRRTMLCASLALTAALAFSAPAAAQSIWVGGFTGGWNQALNWSPNGIPNSPTTAVSFTGNNVGAVNISSSVQTQSISFSNFTGGYTLTSSANQTLTGLTGINVAAGVTGVQTINLANIAGGSLLLTGANNLQITNNSTAAGTTLVIGPDTVIGSLGTGGLIVDGAGTTQITGNFSTTAGRRVVGGLVKNGSGTLDLAYSGFVPTAYNGNTIVNQGTLKLSRGLIQTGTNVIVGGDAKFELGALAGNSPETSIGGLILNGNGAFRVPSGSPAYHLDYLDMIGGTIDLTGSNAVLHLRGANFPNNVFASSTTAIWNGPATSRIQNDSGNPINFFVNAGTTASGIDLDSSISLSSAGNNPTFLKDGPGTMRLKSLSNTANIRIAAGNLRVDDLATGGVGALGSGAMTLEGGTLVYGGPSATTTKNLTLTGDGTIRVLNPGTNLIYAGAMTEVGGQRQLTVLGPGAGTSSSTLTLTNNNSYSASTVIADNAIVAITTINDFAEPSPIGQHSLLLGSPTTRGTLLLTGGGPAYSTNRTITLFGSHASGGGGAIGVGNTGTNLTLNSAITGAGSFIKTGAGSLTLTNPTNNYSGGTFVEAGTLNVGVAGAVIPANSNVRVSPGATFQIGFLGGGNGTAPIGTVTLDGGAMRIPAGTPFYYINGLATTAAGGAVDLRGGSAVLRLDGPGARIAINGNSTWMSNNAMAAIVSANSVTPMDLTIAPACTLTNSVNLQGSFRISGGGALYMTAPPSQWSVLAVNYTVNQGRLRVDDLSVGSPSFPNASVLGAVHPDLLTLDGGALQYSGQTGSTPMPMTLGPAGGTVEVSNASTTLTLTGSVSSNGVLTKAGPGTLILNNLTNAYLGGIAVSGGRLDVNIDAQLGSANPIVNPLGTLRYTANASTARTFTMFNGSMEASNGVTLTFNGAAVGGGFLRGPGAFNLTGGAALAGVTTLTSATINQIGPASVANFTNGGSFTIGAGQTLAWNGGTNTSSGRFVVNGTANVNDFVSNGQVNIPIGGVMNNSGSPLVLGGGSRTFIGSAAAPGGAINLGGQTLELNGGLLVNNGTVSGITNVNFGSLAMGSGTYGVVNVHVGGVYAPGNSPGISTAAAVTFDNTLTTNGAPTLIMELGGTAPGTQYDQLHVSGNLSLGGALAVSLINSFSPAVGQAFDILDWGNLSGTFASINLPTLAGGLSWNTSQLYATGVLSVGLAGDYNNNGVVDGADYVVWRKGLGPTYSQNDYNVWRSYFGQPPASGSGANGSASAAVPEPATSMVLLMTVAGMFLRGRSAAFCSPQKIVRA